MSYVTTTTAKTLILYGVEAIFYNLLEAERQRARVLVLGWLYGANYSPSSFSVMNLVFFHIHCLLLIIWSPQVPCINTSCSPLQVMDWCLVQREGSHVYFLINCHHFDLRQPKTLQELSTKIERIL